MQQNATDEQKLTSKQQALIAALIAGNSHSVAATAIGVDRTTVIRWLKLPHVLEALRDAQKQVFNESLSSLMLYTDEAITTLRTLMKDESVQPQARIRAAQIILEQSIEAFKTSEIEDKLEQLEMLIKDTSR